jgi:hypothetical protein
VKELSSSFRNREGKGTFRQQIRAKTVKTAEGIIIRQKGSCYVLWDLYWI